LPIAVSLMWLVERSGNQTGSLRTSLCFPNHGNVFRLPDEDLERCGGAIDAAFAA
jgi:hypothetical protein